MVWGRSPLPLFRQRAWHEALIGAVLWCAPVLQVPRVALTEMGPQLDCVLRRCRLPPVDLEKEALKQPKLTKNKVRAGSRGEEGVEWMEKGTCQCGTLHTAGGHEGVPVSELQGDG